MDIIILTGIWPLVLRMYLDSIYPCSSAYLLVRVKCIPIITPEQPYKVYFTQKVHR